MADVARRLNRENEKELKQTEGEIIYLEVKEFFAEVEETEIVEEEAAEAAASFPV